MIHTGKPISAYWLANELKANKSSIYSTLRRLETEGIVIRTDRGYMLQPMFYSREFWDEIAEKLLLVIDTIDGYSIIDKIDYISVLSMSIQILTKIKNRKKSL